MESKRQRKILTIALGVVLLLLFLALAALNAFRLSFLNPSTTGEIFLFTALSVIAFLLFLAALLLLVRNTLKLYADQRSRILGARLRTRMLWGAVLLSLLPITCMSGFSYLLMNRAVERWFSQPAAQLRDDSSRIALELSRYVAANARSEAASIASTLSGHMDSEMAASSPASVTALRHHDVTLQGGFALIYQDDHAIVRFHVPDAAASSVEVRPWEMQVFGPETSTGDHKSPRQSSGPLDVELLQAARDADEPVLSIGNSYYVVGSAWVRHSTLVVVALPLPPGLSGNLERLRIDGEQYWTLFRLRRQIRTTYMLLMLMITSLGLFCASWLALHLSKQVTRPVEALADAMTAVSQGNYDRRVEGVATEELGELVAVFNKMAEELENSRHMVELSTVQVVEANTALEVRRRELETMLQTIPNGVVMLDPERRILVANRAFSEMLDPGGQRSFVGQQIESVVPGDAMEYLDRLLRRSHRMSTASSELEMHSPMGTLHIAATVAIMEAGGARIPQPTGYVIVLEDATELLRAQKQAAWKEVARRVAHEIKNPLTPISLSAEQIRRHAVRLAELLREHAIESTSVATIHRSSEVISASVESMRSLVDQFSSLAEFPNAKPRPSDLNTILENTLALFAGRLQDVQVVRSFSPGLPLVMADPEAMKRALSNLIDNAADAMGSSLLREIHIRTALSETSEGMVELVVADTGPGVTDEMRERLFLPYFSTKQRGTGLGLTIVAKIIADHKGTIRTEKNNPSGARFVIDLPIAQTSQDLGSGSHGGEAASPVQEHVEAETVS